MNNLNKRPAPSASFTKIRGVALFEILIALLVLSIGLLGLATMQTQGLRSASSATARTAATFLATDITDRMRSNATLAAPSPVVYVGAWSAPTAAAATCLAGTTGPTTPAQDLCAWTNAIQAQLGGGPAVVGAPATWQASILAAPGAGVGGVPAGALIITIMWDDERTGAAGTGCSGATGADMTCFQTLFQP